jgi:hypothetical protein
MVRRWMRSEVEMRSSGGTNSTPHRSDRVVTNVMTDLDQLGIDDTSTKLDVIEGLDPVSKLLGLFALADEALVPITHGHADKS